MVGTECSGFSFDRFLNFGEALFGLLAELRFLLRLHGVEVTQYGGRGLSVRLVGVERGAFELAALASQKCAGGKRSSCDLHGDLQKGQ